MATLPAQPAPDLFLGFTSTQWILFMAAIAFIFAVRRWRLNTVRQRIRKEQRPADEPRSTPAGVTPAVSMREVSTQVQALLSEVEETARRAAAQIDNRYRKLEQLLAEADERIRRLEALRDQFPGSPEADAAASLAAELRENLHASAPKRPAQNSAYTPVYQLADAGVSTHEIAQRLGKQPGEVELILALRSK